MRRLANSQDMQNMQENKVPLAKKTTRRTGRPSTSIYKISPGDPRFSGRQNVPPHGNSNAVPVDAKTGEAVLREGDAIIENLYSTAKMPVPRKPVDSMVPTLMLPDIVKGLYSRARDVIVVSDTRGACIWKFGSNMVGAAKYLFMSDAQVLKELSVSIATAVEKYDPTHEHVIVAACDSIAAYYIHDTKTGEQQSPVTVRIRPIDNPLECAYCGAEFKAPPQQETSDSKESASQEHVKQSFDNCGRCQRRHYCGKTCQANDWPRHKPFCMKLTSLK